MHFQHTSIMLATLAATGSGITIPFLHVRPQTLDPAIIGNATYHTLSARQAPGCSMPNAAMGSSGCIMSGFDEHGCVKFDNPACQAMMPPWRDPSGNPAPSHEPPQPTTVFVPLPYTASTICTQTNTLQTTRTTMQTVYTTIPVVSFTTATTTTTGLTWVTAQVATPTPEPGPQCLKVSGNGGGAIYHGDGCYEHPGCSKINGVATDGSPLFRGTTCWEAKRDD